LHCTRFPAQVKSLPIASLKSVIRDLIAIRDCTYSGRPLGEEEFTRELEKDAHRTLTPQKRGPKKQSGPAPQQATLFFDPF